MPQGPARRGRSLETTVMAAFLFLAAGLPGQGGAPAKVEVRPAVEQAFQDTMVVVGEVEAYRSSRASAEVDGRVLAADLVEGGDVGTEAVLVRLDTDLLEIRRKRARAELELARQQLAELEAGSRSEEIREAEAARDEAAARLTEAEEDLRRTEELARTQSATEQDLTAAKAAAAAARATLAARQAAYERVLAGPRKERIAQAAATVAIRTAMLDELELDLEHARIHAPFPGRITSKLVEPGHFVQRGDAVFELVEIARVRVVAPVPERVVDQVQTGAALSMKLDALPGVTFEGNVEAVVPEADEESRTYPVKVVLENAERRILPGMVARISVPLSGSRRSVAVPRDALLPGRGGTMVYVVRGGKAVPVEVRPGTAQDGLVAVSGGLQAGEPVVIRGNERLRPGQPVQVLEQGPGSGADGNGR